jgi:hypothetical protein
MKLLAEIGENPQWTAKAWLLERVFREYDPPSTSRQGSENVIVQIAINHPRMCELENTDQKLKDVDEDDHKTLPKKDDEDDQ